MKRKEVFKEGFDDALRHVLRALKEATYVDFDEEPKSKSGTMSRGGWRARVKQNQKEKSRMTDKGIAKNLYKSDGATEKYPGVKWDPRSQHVELEWDDEMQHTPFDRSGAAANDANSREFTTKMNYTASRKVPYRVGEMPSEEDIEKAVDDFKDTEAADAKVSLWTNRLVRQGNSRARQAFMQVCHIVRSSISDEEGVEPEVKRMVCILTQPLDKAELRKKKTLSVWDLQKAEERKVALDTIIYINFVKSNTDEIADADGNEFVADDASYFWTPVASTGMTPSARQKSGRRQQYAYGDKNDPDRVEGAIRHETSLEQSKSSDDFKRY